MNKFTRLSILALVSFATFFSVTVASNLVPYAPSFVAVLLMKYGIGFLFFCGIIWIGFIHRWTAWQETSWARISRSLPSRKERLRKLLWFALALPIATALLSFNMQRWLAYPTIWFASEKINVVFQCISAEKWGNDIRNSVMIIGTSHNLGGDFQFPWAENMAPKCPSMVRLSGMHWVFGTYVMELSN